MRKGAKNIARFLAFLLLAGGAAYVFLFTETGEMFRTAEGRKALVDGLDRAVRAAGPLGPLLFILVYAAGSMVAPVTPFTIAGAVIFGKFYGMFYNLAGDMAGATLSFFLGRYFLHGIARDILETRLPWLDRKAAEEGFTIIFYLRLFWFPFIVLNYAAGATRIRFRDYFLGTVLGILPSVFIVTYFIGALKDLLASYRGPADLVTPQILVPIVLLILSFFIPSLVKRLRKSPER
ncbi:MAG: TVP38/TMEM64 family protein [Thermodesulfobacteriota bacterium]